MRIRSRVLSSLFVALSGISTLIEAQAPITQPGLIERQFQAPPQPRTQAGEFHIPLPSQVAPPEAAGVKFVLRELSVDGVSAYAPATLLADYESLLGREVSLAQIYAVANALTVRYRNDGYILSQVIVPAQAVEGGRVRLQAVEGHVAQVRIEGDPANRMVQTYADRIKAERPLTAATLERYLLLMNDLPGAFARATLVPSATQQGASDLLVQFTQRRASAGLSVDNRGGRALGPVRWSADLEQDGALGWDERSGLRLVSTLDRELDYLSLFHDQALGGNGTRIGAMWNWVRSRTDTSASFIPLDLETASSSGALTLSHPVRRSRSQNLYLRAALTAHNGATALFSVRETQDRIRAVRLGLTFDLADAWRGVNIVDLELGQGLRLAGASRAGDPDLSRANGKADFTKLALYAARLQALAPRWSLLAAVNAQYAFTDLLAPELFSFGGEQFGRGYDPSELVGDHGAAMKLELRYTVAPNVGPLSGATVYGFYDAGFARQRTPAGFAASESAASTGLGLRFDAGRHVSGYIEIAKPLTRLVAAEGDRGARAYAGLSLRF
jgi:hemolysin activation/secretion protein